MLTYIGVIIAHLIVQIAFVIWLLTGFFESVPHEVEEAAIVDSCSPFRVFLNISVPMIIPGIVATSVLIIVVSWNEFLFASFISGYDVQPLTVALARFAGGIDFAPEYAPEYNVIAAFSNLVALPIIIFALFTSRYIVGGLTQGVVKG